jgi:hypothetical protein
LRIAESKWHEYVKGLLKEIGEKSGFDVSESENEMDFPVKYDLFESEPSEKHILTYKPDVVWKKGIEYKTIIEIEYLNPKAQNINKRKYVLGTFVLGLTALHEKSCKNFVFITNSNSLCEQVGSFYEILKKRKILSEHFLKATAIIWYSFDRSQNEKLKDPRYFKRELKSYLSEDFNL